MSVAVASPGPAQDLPGRRLSPAQTRLLRLGANLVGAASAAYFAEITLRAFVQTQRPIGAAILVEQTMVVVCYLVRRPARTTTRRWGDWALAFGGTFLPVLARPTGLHPAWGIQVGNVLQAAGLVLAIASFALLWRSFGFAAGDRGLVRHGPYALVRHPIYLAYWFLALAYILQAFSLRNVVVFALAMACNAGRAIAEDRLLSANPANAAYYRRVRWRMLPGVF